MTLAYCEQCSPPLQKSDDAARGHCTHRSLIRAFLAPDAVIDRTRKLFDTKIVDRELQVQCRSGIVPGLLHIT